MTLSHMPSGIADPDNLKKTRQYIATYFPEIGWKNDTAAYAESEWYEDTYPASSGPCETTHNNEPTKIANQAVWEFVAMSAEDCNAAKRAQYEQDIRLQVQDTTVATTLEDPLIETDIVREQAAASEKRRELDDTADADLDGFSPMLDVKPPQSDFGYARLSIEVAQQEPWVGAPADDTGWRAVLQIQSDYAADGADARLSITDSPKGIDGPLPFTADPDDPLRWTVEASAGKMWQGDDGPVSAVLRWGSGSIIVGRVLTSPSMHVRDSQNVEYGVPSGATI